MTNIIREDVVSVGVDVDGLDELIKLQKELNDLKKKLSGGIGDGAFDELGNSADDAKDDIENLTKENKKLKEELDNVKKAAGVLNDKLTTLSKKGISLAYNGLKKLAGISFKALVGSVTAVATGIGVIAKKSLDAFADYEQLKGGVETLFGAKGAQSIEEYAKYTGKSVSAVKKEYDTLISAQNDVLKNADKAWWTTGLSANDYMSTVTTFSASLIKSLGGDTKKAGELADVALRDMADNANKMGTDISMIQSAYSGIARGNYMMLDNLKLGYAGSKTELERLLKDAEKIKAEMGEKVDYDIDSYADVIQAIHTIQENMGITGTTEKEAAQTVTGSLNAMKASWQNLLIAMGSGEKLDESMDNMLKSAETFANNAIPVVQRALEGMGMLVERVAPIIAEKLPDLAEKLLPPLIKSAVSLVKGLIKALPNIVKTLGTTIAEIFGDQFPIIKQIGEFFAKNSGKIAKFIPVLIGLATAFSLFGKLKGIGSIFSGLFGKGGSGGLGGGLFGGLEKLGKLKITSVLKGMANLAIIVAGFALIIPPMMLLVPLIDALGGVKAFLKIALVMGAMGIVGGVLGTFAGIVGNIPVKTTLKGLANMAIILAGMSAVFLLIGAISLIDFDLGRVMGIVGILGALGILGVALTAFSALVSFIPILVILKGLANLALVIGGMSALFLLIGAVSLIDFDYKRIVGLIGIIGLLGTLGSVLSVFAGIVGLIPIPVVLTGLANIALVMGGITALIIAFGALSKIDGIQEFIASGGDLLAQLFGVIGKIAGSLIGGVGEAVSKSLPAIGTNLAQFGTNVKPLFEAFQGLDMAGVGAFFGALGGFLLMVTGNKILDKLTGWFTGGNSFEQIGKDLTSLAEGAEGFFTIVATLPENSFTNATKLFESLSGMGGLPNSGGVVGWFCGDINYTDIANGLTAFADEGVAKFFKMTSGIAPETFDKATQLFESLSGLGGLPNSGGVSGWFSGGINYDDIAKGLTSLGGDGVKKFFTMAGALEPQAFENVKLLFASLSGMADSLPEKDNWWDKLRGNETVSLSDIATDLSNFAKNSKSFFAMVNSLNLTNLNGLWDSLKKADSLTGDISNKVGTNLDDIVSKVSNLPVRMGDALKNAGQSLADSFVEVWQEAVKASVAPVNKLLSGANHILREFGSKKQVIEWQPYARGTDGHRGGNALVNDGRGAELVQMPNGNAFIPNGRNVFIPNAPKGMKVLPANQTAQLMGRNSPTFNYANGIGDLDVWSYYDNAKGLVDKITENISYKGMNGFASSLGQGMVSTFSGEMPAWIDKLFEECGQSISSYVASRGVTQWLPTVVRALKMEGQYSLLNVARTLFQMKTESGGNPHAINLWDKNAKNGTPSKGLMQVIDPTFNAYARDGFDKNIYDPISNILASIRYAVSRYGSLARAYRGVGYENGGLATRTGLIVENPNHPEWVIPTDPSKRGRALDLWTSAGEMLGISYTPESDGDTYTSNAVEYNTYSPVFEAHFHGMGDERTLKRNVKRWFAESFEEMVDEMDRNT